MIKQFYLSLKANYFIYSYLTNS